MAFQTSVQFQQAPAVTGDFASNNPRANCVGIEASFIAGYAGITVGQFVWIQGDGKSVLNFGTGKPDGFVAREMQTTISDYLQEATMFIPAGYGVTVYRTGDFFMVNNANASVVGDKAFANEADGTLVSLPAGTVSPGYSETDWIIRVAADVGELTVISSVNSTLSAPIADYWVDEFGNIWVDEFANPWTT